MKKPHYRLHVRTDLAVGTLWCIEMRWWIWLAPPDSDKRDIRRRTAWYKTSSEAIARAATRRSGELLPFEPGSYIERSAARRVPIPSSYRY